jgi:hypothetical protein
MRQEFTPEGESEHAPARAARHPPDDSAPSSGFSRAERRAIAAHERRAARAPRGPGAPTLPTDDLVRVARHLEALTGRRLAADAATLRARCTELLADPELAARLAAILRDED